MKRALVSAVVLSSLASFAVAYPTDLVARDKSSRDGGVSAGRGGASVSAGGVSVSAGRGGASVSGGGSSVSADRSGGASVSVDRGGSSGGAGRGDRDLSGGRAPALAADRPPADRSYKSYGSVGEWFDDLRTSWFGGRSERSDQGTTARASATQRTQTSQSGGRQVNRVVQEKSSTATATDGGSAVAKASNVNVTEQKN
ncbi:MAG: hypothetical protein ACREJ5_13750 [Geminicoccaceae bacterium]